MSRSILGNIRYRRVKDKQPKDFSAKNHRVFKLDSAVDQDFGGKGSILFFIDHVETDDLIEGRMLGGETTRRVWSNLLKYSQEYACRIDPRYKGKHKFAFVNFNYFKTYNLSPRKEEHAYKKYFAKRARKLIKKLNPDHIVFMGDDAATVMLKDSRSDYHRGRVNSVDIAGASRKVTHTISLKNLYSSKEDGGDDFKKNVEASNLFGVVSRHIAHALLGYHPFSLRNVKVKPRLVKTPELFREMMAELTSANVVAVDCETEGLSVHNNRLLIIQFATTEKYGWVLPIYHHEAPWLSGDLKLIKSTLRKFFMNYSQFEYKEDMRYFVGQNLKFDLRVIRMNLEIPFIKAPVFDIMEGEHKLDENEKGLSRYNTGGKVFALDVTTSKYDNDFYLNNEVGKGNRDELSSRPLGYAEQLYCASDVVFPLAIHKMQIKRAECEKIGKLSYGKAYKRLMLTVISAQVHSTSDMEMRGTYLDLPELMRLNEKNSPVNKQIMLLEKEIYKTKAAKKANEILVARSGVPRKGLFGSITTWMLNISKPEHRQILFFEVMKLKPLSTGKKGGGKVDKAFQSAYKNNKVVKAYTNLVKANKIRSSYIKAIYKRSEADPDMHEDSRLRPQYSFTPVLTGRSNCFNPSLQQLPKSEGEDLAGLIKRCFVAPQGFIKIKFDYSAHEVRMWGIVSRDKNLAASFQHGKNLRIKYRTNPSPKLAERIKNEGDIHRVNYHGFTGVPIVDIDKAMRQASKGITFGAIYGKSVFTLAPELGKTLEEMQEIYDKFFGKFFRAKEWLEWTSELCKDEYYTYSPLGLKRNLHGALTGSKSIVSALVRRAKNSPIQGIASQLGFVAKRIFDHLMWKFIQENELDYNMPILPGGIDVMVHDSSEGDIRVDLYFVAMYLMEWAATEGVRQFCKEYFNMSFNVGLEVEFEVGAHQKFMHTWDTTAEEQERLLKETLEYQRKILHFDIDPKAAFKDACKVRDKYLPKLMKRYPLDEEIIK